MKKKVIYFSAFIGLIAVLVIGYFVTLSENLNKSSGQDEIDKLNTYIEVLETEKTSLMNQLSQLNQSEDGLYVAAEQFMKVWLEGGNTIDNNVHWEQVRSLMTEEGAKKHIPTIEFDNIPVNYTYETYMSDCDLFVQPSKDSSKAVVLALCMQKSQTSNMKTATEYPFMVKAEFVRVDGKWLVNEIERSETYYVVGE